MNISNTTLFMVLATTAFNIGTTVAGGAPESTAKAPKAPKTGVKTEKAAKNSKSAKSGKSGSSLVESGSSLVAIVESASGSTNAPIGTATIHSNPNGSFLFQLDMENLDQDCTITQKCGVFILEETDCSEVVGYYSPTFFGSNWETSVGYFSNGEGSTSSAFTINTSVDFSDNKGHVVGVFDSWMTPVACGILKTPTKQKVLTASMGLYPGYEPAAGDPTPSGTVTVSFRDDDSFEFAHNLAGLKPNCESCGIHIHAGKSCTDPDLVLGHAWNQYVVSNLWTINGGAYYNADQDGRTDTYFNLFTGFGYEENINHAVVIHTQDGARVGCGILQ